MQLIQISIPQIKVPDWKSKYNDPEEVFKISMSIQKLGQVNPVHVRETEDEAQPFELIDKRSVLSALNAFGHKTAYCINHGKISQHAAKAMHLQLNFSNKSAHPLHLAQLVYDLAQDKAPELLMNELPFTKEQIEYYVKLHEYDWMANLNPVKSLHQTSLF